MTIKEKLQRVQILILPAVIFIIFLLLAAFQILPFQELIRNSNLSAGRSFETVAKWSLTPLELLGFVIPYIRGDINVPSGHLGPQEWLISFYIGVTAVMLIVLLFFLRPSRKAKFFGLALLGGLFIVLGKYTPLYQLLYRTVPGISNIRYPVKFMFVVVFSSSILAGMGLEAIIQQLHSARREKIIKCLLFGNFMIAVFVGLFIFFWQEIGDYLMQYAFQGKEITGDVFNRHVFVYLSCSKYLVQLFIILTMTTILLIAYLKNKIAKNIFVSLILLLVVVGYVDVNMGINKVMSRRYFTSIPQTIRLLQNDQSLFRSYQTKEVWEINRSIFGLNYAAGMYERKKTLACNTAMPYGISSVRAYGSIEVGDHCDYISFLEKQDWATKIKLLRLVNVKYIISMQPIEAAGVEIFYEGKMYASTLIDGQRVYRGFYISRVTDPLPRAFLVPDAVFVDDEALALGIMESQEFDPERVVVVEEQKPETSNQKPENKSPDIGSVKIMSYRPEEIVIKVKIDNSQWLVLSDTYYPGWRVYIDGREGEIYKANYFMRAVHVPAGKHEVRFVYQPKLFSWGLWISLVALLVCIGILIRSRLSLRPPTLRRGPRNDRWDRNNLSLRANAVSEAIFDGTDCFVPLASLGVLAMTVNKL